MRARSTLALLVLVAVAAGACDEVLGLGVYNLACDAGNGGCGGNDTADAAGGASTAGTDAAP